MHEKLALEYYDVLSVVVPGSMLLCWLPICFPQLLLISVPPFPQAFQAIVLLAAAIFAGQVNLALASLLQGAMYWSWGGRPSDRALESKLPGYFPEDSARRIRSSLERAVHEDTGKYSLFLFAMQLAENSGNARVSRFNSLYAYNRNVLVLIFALVVLYLLSLWIGSAHAWPQGTQIAIGGGLALLLVLFWHRAKQRACYYVREVLLCAGRQLKDGNEGDRTGE